MYRKKENLYIASYVCIENDKIYTMANVKLRPLPLEGIELETTRVLKLLPNAHRELAALKVLATAIPNQSILINALCLQEAKDSSAVENIITTHDDYYKTTLFQDQAGNAASKEVQNYVHALKTGFNEIQQLGILSINGILKIQEHIERNKAGFRKLPGTDLRHAETGKVVYTPPQHPDDIVKWMRNLEQYINDDELDDLDPLVKMAIIHFQFESIHPFYDGNGRTGRIINVLYLILQGLQELPILYLSGYIIEHKAEYYHYLQKVRDEGDWESWILFMIQGVTQMAKRSIVLIQMIKNLMAEMKQELRGNYKFYSPALLNHLFQHPYTKIDFLVKELGVSRITATSYLDQLTLGGILVKHSLGRSHYFINHRLMQILAKH